MSSLIRKRKADGVKKYFGSGHHNWDSRDAERECRETKSEYFLWK